MDWSKYAAVGLAALVAGIVNSIAGGGTLLSFPAAIAAGLPPTWANATNSVALTPGSLIAAWAFRREVRRHARLTLLLLGPGLVGGLIGSMILRHSPERWFEAVVPWLVLGATLIMLLQGVLVNRLPRAREGRSRIRLAAVLGCQLLVGMYGGYFGAAMGIVMLALYSSLRELDIHHANGIKNVISGSINCMASVYFLFSGIVDYGAALVMAIGASIGGLLGARFTRTIKPATVRRIVIAIGFALSALLAYRHHQARRSGGKSSGHGHVLVFERSAVNGQAADRIR